jgi:nitric oxide dioxygenase
MEKVVQEADRAIPLFYGRLFIIDPALCSLFPTDVSSHGRRFLNTLDMAVSGLAAPETIIPIVMEIGRFHTRMGIQPQHYHSFGEALFWTLSELLGEAFTEEAAQAWTEAYYLLAGLMKEAVV